MSGVNDTGVIGRVNLPGIERSNPVTPVGMSTLAASRYTKAAIASRREVRAILRLLRELIDGAG